MLHLLQHYCNQLEPSFGKCVMLRISVSSNLCTSYKVSLDSERVKYLGEKQIILNAMRPKITKDAKHSKI